MCTKCVSGACGVQKRVLNPLGLELQMVVNHRVGRCRDLNSGPLLLTAEPTLQSHCFPLEKKFNMEK